MQFEEKKMSRINTAQSGVGEGSLLNSPLSGENSGMPRNK